MTRWVGLLWSRVTEPRHLKALYFCVYALTAIVGIFVLTVPPRTFDGDAGPAASATLAWLLIAGGLAGMVTVFPGWWWAERLALATVLLGLVVLVTSLFILNAQHASDDESRAAQIGITMLATVPFFLRWSQIREYSYEPRR